MGGSIRVMVKGPDHSTEGACPESKGLVGGNIDNLGQVIVFEFI